MIKQLARFRKHFLGSAMVGKNNDFDKNDTEIGPADVTSDAGVKKANERKKTWPRLALRTT